MNINRRKTGFGASVVGLILNISLFIGKLFVGLMSGSVAIIVDSFNSLSDTAGTIVAMVGFSVSGRRKGSKYPYGYGRIEYIAGLVISMMIMFTALVLGQASCERFFRPVFIEFSWVFLSVPTASIVLKLAFFIYLRFINRKIQSGILVVLSRDSLFDALATSVALLPLIFTSIDFPVDAVVGLLLSIFILISGLMSFVQNAEPILGIAFKSSHRARIRKRILHYKSFSRVKSMQLHDYGKDKTIGTIEVELNPKNQKKAYADLVSVQNDLKRRFNLEATIFWRG